jgi:hypothetical protein
VEQSRGTARLFERDTELAVYERVKVLKDVGCKLGTAWAALVLGRRFDCSSDRRSNVTRESIYGLGVGELRQLRNNGRGVEAVEKRLQARGYKRLVEAGI